MKKSTLRLLIREVIEQVFEAEIKYNVGDRVEIDSSENGGIGTVELASHPNYAIKFDQTGVTESYHFSDLRPFDDEEEDEKNKDIDTGLDESSIKKLNTDDVVAAIQRSDMVDSAKQLIFKAYRDGKITAKSAIKVIEKISSNKTNENVKKSNRTIQIKSELNEVDSDKIFHIGGILIVDDTTRNQKSILSDIRSLPGITVVRNIEMVQDSTSRYFRSTIECKIDPYPFIKQNNFDSVTTIKSIITQIKAIKGVIGFRSTITPYTTLD